MTNEPSANIYDVGAITVWLASLAQILPSIAALLSVIWFIIRIAESQTVQQLLGSYAWIRSKNGTTEDRD